MPVPLSEHIGVDIWKIDAASRQKAVHLSLSLMTSVDMRHISSEQDGAENRESKPPKIAERISSWEGRNVCPKTRAIGSRDIIIP